VLNWFKTELGKGWDERAVGRTIYLAHLVFYWKAVSGKTPAWKHIAALVEGARTALGSSGTLPTETNLRLSLKSFIKRNAAICDDLMNSLVEYLASADSKISFFKWDRDCKRAV
jgi:hypothetical protein